MRYPDLPLCGSLLLALALAGCIADPEPSLHGEQGFKEAIFDEYTLDRYMSAFGVDGLRFYNARRNENDTEGSAIVIGTTKDGEDHYGVPGPLYRLSDKVAGTIVTYYVMTESRALESVRWVQRANEASYAANFSSDEVGDLLRVAGCNGVRVSPQRTADEKNWTIRLTAVQIADGEVRDLGSYRVSNEPCPTLCGLEPKYYLNMR